MPNKQEDMRLLISSIIAKDNAKVMSHIDKNNDVNYRDENGQTLLIHATLAGNYKIAEFLIERGAKIDMADNYGQTPLIHASANDNVDIMRLLIQKGANINYNPKINTKNYDVEEILSSSTPLISAVRNENIKAIKLLLEKGAKLDKRNLEGDTAITIAQIHSNKDVINMLRPFDNFKAANTKLKIPWYLRIFKSLIRLFSSSKKNKKPGNTDKTSGVTSSSRRDKSVAKNTKPKHVEIDRRNIPLPNPTFKKKHVKQ